jgi:hypothetical protein
MVDKPHWTPTAREAEARMREVEREKKRREQIRQDYLNLSPALIREALSQRSMRIRDEWGGKPMIQLDLELDEAENVAAALGLDDRAAHYIDTLVIIARQREQERRNGR